MKLNQKIVILACFALVSGCSDPQSESTSTRSMTYREIVDLTYTFDSTTVYWPTETGFQLNSAAAGYTDRGYYYAANSFGSAEHGGTHLDAPVHFSEGKNTTDEIPLEKLIGPGVKIDVSEAALIDRDYQIKVKDLEQWEEENGRIPEGAIVLFHTGYGQFWPDRKTYMGTNRRGAEGVAQLHFPGIHPDAARWLTQERLVDAVGIDTPSIDYGQSQLFETHQVLFAQNMPAFENVANTADLPASGFEIIALPMKIGGGSGGPLRIVALLL